MSFSIRIKLVAFGAMGLALSGAVGLIALRSTRSLSRAIEEVELGSTVIRNHMEADMMHDALRGDVFAALEATNPTEQQSVLTETKEHSDHFRESLHANDSLPLSEAVRQALTQTQAPLDEYIAQAQSLVSLAVQDKDAVRAKLPEFQKAFSALEEQLSAVSDLIEKVSNTSVQAADSTKQSALRATIGALAVALALSTLTAFLLVRLICRPVGVLIACVKDIAQGEGDLTQRIEANRQDELGELGRWFNVFLEKIECVIAEVKSGAALIGAGGTQIASASQSLAHGASDQASSLQQISASIEQMSGQTQQSSENTRQASALAEESKKSADRGQREMAQMNIAVSEIKQSSTEISKIIKVIDEIAFQTNLLALNAAVEAARAGEAGKGFAVVAEEVRNLAKRSAEAAKSTSAMIEESVKRSENGVAIATRVGTALEEITSATNKVNALLSEIASASSEQATGIGQVNQGVSQLDQVTQQNAGNSEELASSAEELSSQVASLNDLVSQFKVNTATNSIASRSTTSTGRPIAATPTQATCARATAPSHSATKKTPTAAERTIPLENEETLASF